MITNCIECGKEFNAENPQKKICSDECRRVRNRMFQRRYFGYESGIIPCRACGKDFNAVHNQKLCSDECRKQQRRNAQRRQREEEKRLDALYRELAA